MIQNFWEKVMNRKVDKSYVARLLFHLHFSRVNFEEEEKTKTHFQWLKSPIAHNSSNGLNFKMGVMSGDGNISFLSCHFITFKLFFLESLESWKKKLGKIFLIFLTLRSQRERMD